MRGRAQAFLSQQLHRRFYAAQAEHAESSPWEVLGVPPGASQQAISAAFRRQALRLHPDAARGRVDDPEAFVRLVAAYETAKARPHAQQHAAAPSGRQREQQQHAARGDAEASAAKQPAGPAGGTAMRDVPTTDLLRWRYGVGAWLARKRALTEGSTSSRQGSTTGLVHELLQRYQHELAGDVGAALVRAYVGPRLHVTPEEPLPLNFEAEVRKSPGASPDLVHLVSGRTLLARISTLPPPQQQQPDNLPPALAGAGLGAAALGAGEARLPGGGVGASSIGGPDGGGGRGGRGTPLQPAKLQRQQQEEEEAQGAVLLPPAAPEQPGVQGAGLQRHMPHGGDVEALQGGQGGSEPAQAVRELAAAPQRQRRSWRGADGSDGGVVERDGEGVHPAVWRAVREVPAHLAEVRRIRALPEGPGKEREVEAAQLAGRFARVRGGRFLTVGEHRLAARLGEQHAAEQWAGELRRRAGGLYGPPEEPDASPAQGQDAAGANLGARRLQRTWLGRRAAEQQHPQQQASGLAQPADSTHSEPHPQQPQQQVQEDEEAARSAAAPSDHPAALRRAPTTAAERAAPAPAQLTHRALPHGDGPPGPAAAGRAPPTTPATAALGANAPAVGRNEPGARAAASHRGGQRQRWQQQEEEQEEASAGASQAASGARWWHHWLEPSTALAVSLPRRTPADWPFDARTPGATVLYLTTVTAAAADQLVAVAVHEPDLPYPPSSSLRHPSADGAPDDRSAAAQAGPAQVKGLPAGPPAQRSTGDSRPSPAPSPPSADGPAGVEALEGPGAPVGGRQAEVVVLPAGRIKVFRGGRLLVGLQDDYIFSPTGRLLGRVVRGGSLGVHCFHVFDMTGSRRMRLAARAQRSQLADPSMWLFPPRAASHASSSWYIERARQRAEGAVADGAALAAGKACYDACLPAFLAAFASLRFEQAAQGAGAGAEGRTSAQEGLLPGGGGGDGRFGWTAGPSSWLRWAASLLSPRARLWLGFW